MNKLSSTSIFALFVAAVLAVGGFLVGYTRLLAGVPGRYLAADLSAADLSGIASNHPDIFWLVFIVFIVLCAGYGITVALQRKKLKPTK